MSTTTNFKRIALVAVAALGLGVLTSVPSGAAINADTVTLSAATAAQTTAETYTATSATVTVSFLPSAQLDSMTLTASLIGLPAGSTALPSLRLIETASSQVNVAGVQIAVGDGVASNTSAEIEANAAAATTTAKFAVYLEKTSNAAPTVVGAYTVRLTPATVGGSGAIVSTPVTLTINVTAAAALDTTASAAKTTAFLQSGGNNAAPTTDSVVSGVRTAGNNVGFLYINQLNAAGSASSESLTVAISGAGTLGFGAGAGVNSSGRSLSIAAADTVTIFSDGISGKGTITVTGGVSGALLATKTVNFYGAMTSLAGTSNIVILAESANTDAITVVAKDANSSTMTALIAESLYAFSSDTTIATVASSALTYGAESATVTVTGVKAGSATITFGNASTLAASTIKSAPVSVRIGSTAVASVTVAFDKTSYVPGEKATITVSLKDSTGQLVVPGTYELYGTGYGLNFAKGFSQGTAPALTETSIATVATTGLKTYTVYMPVTTGTVTLTGTLAKTGDALNFPLGTLLTAAAIQGTAVTASATVTDSGAAALAAVTALATTVATLKTLITTLTNLVLKIQKKVKA